MDYNSANFKRIEPVNIRKVFKLKNPAMARFIPGFIYTYLEKVLCQKEVNNFLEKSGDQIGVDFCEAAIKEWNNNLIIEDEENMPKPGRYIFVANHPLGGFDGIMLMHFINKYFSKFKFLVNDILMNITNLQPLFIPLNKHGRQNPDSAKTIDILFSSDTQILTFPAGLVSRKIKGQIMDLVWQKNFIVKAVKYERDIVPIFISGKNTNFFYRIANIRKFFGIKANIEMLYLVDETFKHKNKEIRFKIGKPISYKTFDQSKKPIEWAKWVKNKVYLLNRVTNVPL